MWCAYERLSWLNLSATQVPCAAQLFAGRHFDESRFVRDPVLSPSGVTDGDPSPATRKRSRLDGVDSLDIEHERLVPAAAATPPRARQPREGTSGLTVGIASLAVSPSPHKDDAELTLVALLCILGTALHALHGFVLQQAVSALHSLPARHYGTAYVQDLVARCHLELAEYKEAADVYARSFNAQELGRCDGIEFYSTALWHLKKDVELGCLARRALSFDRQKPQVWCVVGNCFSSQREHGPAIRCFRRAIQTDPSFTYAYTLCAHEYAADEKFDKAIEMYERAIHIDCRHYNAWWGLGNVYLRQEEHQNARYHFRKAVEINASNAVLRLSLGLACQALGESEQALELFTQSARSGAGALAHYHKGCILASLGRGFEAIAELQPAKTLAPREPCIYFRLGKLYGEAGEAKKALVHLSAAMDLCGDGGAKDHQILVSAHAELQRNAEAPSMPVDEMLLSPDRCPMALWEPASGDEESWRELVGQGMPGAGSGLFG